MSPVSLPALRTDLEPPTFEESFRTLGAARRDEHPITAVLARITPAFGGALACHALLLHALGTISLVAAIAVGVLALVPTLAVAQRRTGRTAALLLSCLGPLALVAALSAPGFAWNWLDIPIFLFAATAARWPSVIASVGVFVALVLVEALTGTWSVAGSVGEVAVFTLVTHAGLSYGAAVRDIQARASLSSRALWRFEAILHHLPGAVMVQPPVGHPEDVFVSDGLRRLLGHSTADGIGLFPADLVHPDELSTWRAALRTVQARPGWTLTTRHRLRHRDGHWLHVDIRATNLISHPHVRGVLFVFGDVSDQVRRRGEVERHLTWAATHDALTNLPNRRFLMEQLGPLWAAAHARGHRIAVLYCDVDGFKGINDSLGHAVGDVVLVEVAHRLREGLREQDLLGRIGGDEFIAVLSDIADDAEAELVANRLVMANRRPIDARGHLIHLSVSVGVAFSDGPVGNVDRLIRLGDEALYAAKHAGRDRAHIAGRAGS